MSKKNPSLKVECKLTDEDMELMEMFHYPPALVETLFSDVNNLTEFKEDVFCKVRLYQYPMMSFEPFFCFKGMASTPKAQFKLRKNVGETINMCARKIGKCEYINNECTLASGKIVKFKDLVGKSANIISLNEDTWKLEPQKAYFADNGIKECYRLITTSGKNITVTENHPFLTAEGWKPIKEISTDEYIATPRILPSTNNKKVDENLVKLLGYLLGDGGCTQSSIGFTNINEELIAEYKQLAEYFNCDLRQEGITYKAKKKPDYRRKGYKKGIGYIKGEGNSPCKIAKLVRKYKINKLAKEKTIPKEVFTWSHKYIAILLNRLFACDGHINVGGNKIEITLASKKMIYQIQSLLLKFEIHSDIYFKLSKFKDKKFNAWRLIIGLDYNKFLDCIGVKSKDNVPRKTSTFSTGDRIPKKLLSNVYHLFEGYKLHCGTRNMHPYNSSRKKWQKIASHVNNQEINKIAFSDILWERVSEIKKVGELPTVAVTVPKNKNYVSNNIISHNTVCAELLDIPVSAIHDAGWETAISAPNKIHLERVWDKLKSSFESHTIMSEFIKRCTGGNTPKFEGKNGWSLSGINMNLKSKSPGEHWVGFHVKKHWGEEYSYETDEVANHRRGSISPYGVVKRISGMTNFTRFTPAGQEFYAPENANKILNYPELVSPDWDAEEKKERIQEYGGEDAISYKIFVMGQVVEDGYSCFDIERVKKCYMPTKEVIRFEIDKKEANRFKELIVVERPKNCDRLFIASDVGDGAGATDIIILSEKGNKYRYLYNIVLHGLTEPEQERIFNWLIHELNANVIAFDCGDALGRSLYNNLSEKIQGIQDNLVYYAGAKKVVVGFEKEHGEVVFKGGNPVEREEFMSEWSVRRLKSLLYEMRLEIPKDYKFDAEFNSVVALKSGTRTTYECTSPTGDHNFSAFRVFSIAQWLKKDFNMTPEISSADWGIGAIA